MKTVIVDYNSGNLRSAEKSFQHMANAHNRAQIIVSADPQEVRKADRLVLPGVGAFADCKRELCAVDGLMEAINSFVVAGRPFLGVCVGMQMLATRGLEHGESMGFDWISGDVVGIEPKGADLKIPHMGWNALYDLSDHPLWRSIGAGEHMYFVHSYHLMPDDPSDCAARVDHGQPLTAAVARDNIFGTQFHPEKSQTAGLQLIANFLNWRP